MSTHAQTPTRERAILLTLAVVDDLLAMSADADRPE